MSVTLQLPLVLKTDKQFEQLAAANCELQLELTTRGELIMPPTRGETDSCNGELARLWLWHHHHLGKAFESSTVRLPNGVTRPAWVSLEQWNALTQAQRKKFLPLCPFVIELLLETKELAEVRAKLPEYIDNGLRLGCN